MDENTQYNRSVNGAMRESIGTKIKTNLVPYELIGMAAVGLEYGAEKYEERNFEKGLSAADLCESIKRHLLAFENREANDADSGLPHLALVASSVAMLCHNAVQGVMIDDRPPAKAGVNISGLAKEFQNMLNQRGPDDHS